MQIGSFYLNSKLDPDPNAQQHLKTIVREISPRGDIWKDPED